MTANYYIILLSDGLALVPSTWLTDDNKLCYWPKKYTKSKIDTAIRNEETPQVSKDWSLLRITRIYGSSDTFEQGVKKLKKCEYETDLESGNTTHDENDENLLKKTRYTRAVRKDSSESDESEDPSTTQRSEPKSSRLPQAERNKILSSFPEPPQSLSAASYDLNFDKNPPCVIRRDEQLQKPVVVATFESPIINEKLIQKNRSAILTSSIHVNDNLLDHNDNTPHIDTTPKRKPLHQQARYTPTIDSNGETDFRKEILRKLNKLMLDVALIKETVQTLKSEKNNIVSNVNPEVMQNFPLVTLQQLQQIEVKLEDGTFFQELVKTLCGVGGHDVNNTTTNVLKRLLSNALAETYSILGEKNKQAFSELKLMKVVIEAVQFHNKDATEITITKCIGRWLAQAKQRHEREMEKLQRRDPSPSLDK